MNLSRVTVTIKDDADINEVAGLLGTFDFIVTMIDRAEGQIMGFIPTLSVEALEFLEPVETVEVTSKVESTAL